MIRCAFFVALLAPLLAAASGVQALFDLGVPAGAPFPSDRWTVRDTSQNTAVRVDLPHPDCSIQVSDCKDIDILSTLDGFNLQPRLSIPFSGPIDVTSVSSQTVLLVSLGNVRHGADHEHRVRTIGINQVVWDVMTNTLHVESDELLDQHARYVLIVTRGVKDMYGQPVEAAESFERFRNGHGGDLEDYRVALLQGLGRANAAGLHPKEVVAASVFTTQSVTAIIETIRAQINAATPEPADFLLVPGGTRTVFPLSSVSNIIFGLHLRTNPDSVTPMPLSGALNFLKNTFPGAVGQIAFGKYRSPDYLVPCSQPLPLPCDRFIPPVATRTGTPAVLGSEEIFFNLFLPSAPAPRGGWPVVIFGTGSDDSKNASPLRVASMMAAHGLALISINGVGQGLGPLSTLTVRLAGGDVSFSAGGRSFDQDGNDVIGTGSFPTAEGVETLSQGTSIARRDARRQTAIDLMQLVRVIEVGMDVDGDGVADLDASRIYYFGFSHGADLGTIFAATEPRVRAAVLTAVGGTVESFRVSPVNRPGVGRYLERRSPPLLNPPGIATLDGVPVNAPRFDENQPLRNQPPVINLDPGGIAMEIQRVIDNTQWVLQANDPTAHAAYLRKNPLDGAVAKAVIVQFARGDQTIPNPATTALLRSGDLSDRATFFRNDLAFPSIPTLTKNPHPFAIRAAAPTPAQITIALQAQRQIAEFFASDGSAVIDPDGPCVPEISGCLFEAPIEGPLPEDLGFIP